MKTILLTCLLMLVSSMATAKTEQIFLTKDNTVAFSQVVNQGSVSTLIQEITKMDASLKSGYPIYLVLYTPGGSIQAGLELIEYLTTLNRPVHTVTMFAASMGWQIAQHLGKRYILTYGVLMSHRARGGFQGEFGGGFSQIDSRYGLWLRRVNMMDEKTVERAGGKQTLESYRSAYASELWLNGPEAVEQGYADAVASVQCDKALAQELKEETVSAGFFSIKAKFSACPLNTSPVSMEVSLYTNEGLMTLEDFLQKDGKFGDDCTKSTVDSWTKRIIKSEDLCAKDKTLTLDKIQKKLKETEDFFNRDLKTNIVYSY